MNEARLRWQCRRGMRELDELLLGYFEREFAAASERERTGFSALLALPDPELVGYLLGGDKPADPVIAHVVRKIRDRPSS